MPDIYLIHAEIDLFSIHSQDYLTRESDYDQWFTQTDGSGAPTGDTQLIINFMD